MLNAMTCAYPPSDGDVELNRDYAINVSHDNMANVSYLTEKFNNGRLYLLAD